MRKLYKIFQTENTTENTFSSALVVASSEFQAKRIHPASIAQEDGAIIIYNLSDKDWELVDSDGDTIMKFEEDSTWTDIQNVQVEYLGEYKDDLMKEKVIIVSSL